MLSHWYSLVLLYWCKLQYLLHPDHSCIMALVVWIVSYVFCILVFFLHLLTFISLSRFLYYLHSYSIFTRNYWSITFSLTSYISLNTILWLLVSPYSLIHLLTLSQFKQNNTYTTLRLLLHYWPIRYTLFTYSILLALVQPQYCLVYHRWFYYCLSKTRVALTICLVLLHNSVLFDHAFLLDSTKIRRP